MQFAAREIDEARRAAEIAVERGAKFIDINCGCPIHDTVRRGLGADMLRRPRQLGALVEGLTRSLRVPVTVKVRLGWSEDRINVHEVARIVEASGAHALTVHGRTREQRYSKEANWEMIGEVSQGVKIPVIGNGDILTHYEASDRLEKGRCTALMIGRGALIKPWIFREIKEGVTWCPSPAQRLEVYHQLTLYMKEHFREDEKGRKRAMDFLPWHLGFFARFRPLPEKEFAEVARSRPLIQTRLDEAQHEDPLERVLRDSATETHRAIAEILWNAADLEEVVARVGALEPRSAAIQINDTESNG